jgi:hypothetical protein
MRRLENFVRKYGPILYHALQSQAAHAGVSARLRRKLDVISVRAPATHRPRENQVLPLFPDEGYKEVDVKEPFAIGA